MHAAFQACKKEFKKLYAFIYTGPMLYLWLWYPAYAQSAARALCSVVTITTDSTPAHVDVNDNKDCFMKRQFDDGKDVVMKLWQQFGFKDVEVEEIVRMSHTDHASMTQQDLVTTYPNLDKFFFLVYDALCTANHYIEGTFSNVNSLLRINMSDGRLDRHADYKQNVLHKLRKEVVAAAKKRMASKGCKGTTRLAASTRPDVQHLMLRIKDVLQLEYRPENFQDLMCPTNRSHRDSHEGKITAQNAKTRQTLSGKPNAKQLLIQIWTSLRLPSPNSRGHLLRMDVVKRLCGDGCRYTCMYMYTFACLFVMHIHDCMCIHI